MLTRLVNGLLKSRYEWNVVRQIELLSQAFSSLASSTAERSELIVYGSCVLARAPVIKPLPEEWEIKYQKWATEIRSRRQDTLPDHWQKIKKGPVDDIEEKDDAESWMGASRTTEADEKGDVKSLMRCLDHYLYFVVQRSSGEWCFPSCPNQNGETIRQTGQRALSECIGADADVFFIANWPIAHVPFQADSVPRIEFFMKAQLLSGNVYLLENSEYKDHAWIARNELGNYLTASKFKDTIERALL